MVTQRYFLHLAYQGTLYRGWQRQTLVKSVQETLELALSKILKEHITVTGCGRTDAKVHARQFYAHMDVNATWNFDLIFRLNKNLPDDIVVFEIFPVDSRAHSRHDATSRTYDYYFHNQHNPFLDRVSSHYDDQNLNLQEMLKACALIKSHQDFGSLCKRPEIYESTLCEILETSLTSNASQTIFKFQIKANRFLRGMVRILMYEILNIGRGVAITERLLPLLLRETGLKEKQLAHPQGLYLSKIEYPTLHRDVEQDFLSEFNMMPIDGVPLT